ncbi:putative conserved with signal peptide [Cryptosporidium sp. chipmunk genotype I]|uniref:putative conserved with signal peptide n=1 Tax=Cryptosporidium sp. chipmunk genotype I TaxID=1280935 RepID=UPI00351A500B|nr:putative conserved with signal peptide [Cryptosporidium sp. chipmunk genotype I]
MSRKEKLNIKRPSTSQNLQLLIVWTIFLGIIVIFFHLIYKYLIKKLFNYILNIIGIKDFNNNTNVSNINNNTNSHDRMVNTNSGALIWGEIEPNLQNENLTSTNYIDGSIFRVSIGFCYSKEAENLKKLKVKQSLIKLSSFTDLFLFIQVDTDQDEQIILGYMQEFGIFKAGLKKHRLVFCEKPESIPSMARQLQANMHIDTNQDNAQKLLNKVPNISILTLDDDGSSLYELVEAIESVATSQK